MKYCTECGSPVDKRIPAGDNRLRHVCTNCGYIHYSNPQMVVGAIPEIDDALLLCKRAIEPRKNMWTLPAGYLENNETLEECARRESYEEGFIELGELKPYAAVDLPLINQVYFIFHGKVVNRDFRPGEESLEVKLFSLSEIPWENIAFQSIKKVLETYSSDFVSQKFPFRILMPELKMEKWKCKAGKREIINQ